MAADPFAQFADAPAETVGPAAPANDQFGGFADAPIDDATPPAAAQPVDYNHHIQLLINAGAKKQEVEDYARSVGIDPAKMGNLDAGIEYKAKGGKGIVRVVPQADDTSHAVIDHTPAGSFGMGVRGVMTGAGGLLDMAAGPINAAINALPGKQGMSTTPFRDAANAGADWLGLDKPISDTERLVNAGVEGGAGGLATFGAGAAAAGAGGAAGAIGKALTAAPGADIVSGITGGASGEEARQFGAGPVTQFLAAILGGIGGAAGAAGASRVAARLTPRVAKVIDTTPAEAVLASDGSLNEHGRELAQRAGVPEDALAESYARVRTGTGPRPRPYSQAGREAFRNRPRGTIMDHMPTRPEDLEPIAPSNGPAPLNTDALVAGIGRRVDELDRQNVTSPDREDGRFAEAASEGVQLTRGQAEQDFKVQNDEQSLYSSTSAEGNRARQFREQQAEQIADAATRFRECFGATDSTPAERGQAVKDAIGALRDQGREGVNRLYREAEAAGGGGLPLETDAIHDAATDILIHEGVPETVKRSISQELARYGLIGEAAPMNEAGLTKVTLDDGSSVSFRGPPKQLTVANAEDLRKAVNTLYTSDPTKMSQSLKPAIDDAVEQALEQAAIGEAGPVSAAYQVARAGHRAQRETFHAKDIIEHLIAVRKGTQTPTVLPERVISQTLGFGPGAVTNIRKVKAILLSGGTPGTKQAWRGIQAQTVANLFEEALSTQTQTISGAKLNSAITKFGVGRLKLILEPPEFNHLMKLRRIIGDATIPMSGTINPSGTFTKLVNFMGAGVLRLTPGIGPYAKALAGKARNLAARQKTLEGMTSYDGNQATAQRLDEEARNFVAEYIKTAGSGTIIRSGLTASTPKEQQSP